MLLDFNLFCYFNMIFLSMIMFFSFQIHFWLANFVFNQMLLLFQFLSINSFFYIIKTNKQCAFHVHFFFLRLFFEFTNFNLSRLFFFFSPQETIHSLEMDWLQIFAFVTCKESTFWPPSMQFENALPPDNTFAPSTNFWTFQLKLWMEQLNHSKSHPTEFHSGQIQPDTTCHQWPEKPHHAEPLQTTELQDGPLFSFVIHQLQLSTQELEVPLWDGFATTNKSLGLAADHNKPLPTQSLHKFFVL